MAPPLITVVPGKTQPIDHYEYLPPGSAKPLLYQPQEVLHIRRPNPHSQHFGVGIIAGGPQMFDAELALTSSFGGYFERGTRLSGVIESERSIPDKLWRKIVREFRQMFSRNENSWDVAALERGLTYRPLSATAAQAEYGALIPLSRDRICAAFRVPPALLGFIGTAATTPVKEAQRIFDNKTMRPFLNKLQQAITYGLTQAWGVDFKIDYEYVMPIEDQFQMAKDFATLPGVRIREVRDRVNLEPLGDERDDIVLNLPGDGHQRLDRQGPLHRRARPGGPRTPRTRRRSRRTRASCPPTRRPLPARSLRCQHETSGSANSSLKGKGKRGDQTRRNKVQAHYRSPRGNNAGKPRVRVRRLPARPPPAAAGLSV